MNPTNWYCPSDIAQMVTTDHRPSKVLYENVHNNNRFRSYLQRNGNMIMYNNLHRFANEMNCKCENNPWKNMIQPFDSSHLDRIASE